MRRFGVAVFVLFAVLALHSGQASALEVPKAPRLETPIVDQTGTLTSEQLKLLADQIATSRKEKDYQIGVLVISTLGNSDYLEGFSLKVARAWGIGEKDKSNGVLLLVALDDREIRIEVGRGLEGDLTDVKTNRIIRNVIAPRFKEGKYYEGIRDGVNSIQLTIAGKVDPATEKDPVEEVDWGAVISTAVFFVIAGLSWLAAILGRSKSWWAGGVIGGVAGLLLLLILGATFWTIFGLVGLILGGLGLDFAVSKNYKQHVSDHSNPAWWAGGTWGGGGGWGGGSGGGFGGGGASCENTATGTSGNGGLGGGGGGAGGAGKQGTGGSSAVLIFW